MSRHIAEEVSTRIGWGAFTTIGMIPPRDPDEEDEDEGEEDGDDEPAVVREPDED
jgi:hypothetical protein